MDILTSLMQGKNEISMLLLAGSYTRKCISRPLQHRGQRYGTLWPACFCLILCAGASLVTIMSPAASVFKGKTVDCGIHSVGSGGGHIFCINRGRISLWIA